jgi:hypothetical protein
MAMLLGGIGESADFTRCGGQSHIGHATSGGFAAISARELTMRAGFNMLSSMRRENRNLSGRPEGAGNGRNNLKGKLST